MTNAPASHVDDPIWLAHRYDPPRDAIHFVRADRNLRAAVPFLTDEYLPGATAPFVLDRLVALRAAPTPAPVHFIFHAAYCCSTLLAAAFDRPGLATSLKEPVILNDLVGWRHRGADANAIGARLRDSLTLLSRPFDPGEVIIVKPSNVVNALIPAMLALQPSARALLLYAPLPVYLASIARKGLWGRLWVRDLFAKQLADGLIDFGFQNEDYLKLTDLQVAAVGWLAQLRLFEILVRRHPDRVRTLDSETLLARPAEALSTFARLCGLPMSEPEAQAIATGPVFQRDAKTGNAFSADDRMRGQQQRTMTHADEIDKVVTWIAAVAASADVSLYPGGPLLT